MYSAFLFTMKRTLCLSLMLVMSLALSVLSRDKQNPKPENTQNGSTQQQRGAEQNPVFVKHLPSLKTAEASAQEAQDRASKSANDTNVVNLTGQLVIATYTLAAIGVLQLVVFGIQAVQLARTVKSAGEQAEAMERHIGQAERSAKAMEDIVSVINFGNHAAMRAYLTVIIGQAIYQEKREGQSDLKFEAKPILVNTGNTPARKIRIRIAADILPIPPPEEFEFPAPDEKLTKDAGVVGAHQNAIISGMVKDFVPYSEVAGIKEGLTKALCVWGFVTYEDMFGASHRTQFGQWITWLPDGKVFGYYMAGQNDAD